MLEALEPTALLVQEALVLALLVQTSLALAAALELETVRKPSFIILSVGP